VQFDMMNLNTRAFRFETTAREVTSLVRVRSKQLSLAYVVTELVRVRWNMAEFSDEYAGSTRLDL
jgi:hypothetical protein